MSIPCFCASEAAVKLLSVMQYAKYVLITTAGVSQLWLASAQPQQHTHTHTHPKHACKQTHALFHPHPQAKLQSVSYAHLLPQQWLLSKHSISHCFPSRAITTGQKYAPYLSHETYCGRKDGHPLFLCHFFVRFLLAESFTFKKFTSEISSVISVYVNRPAFPTGFTWATLKKGMFRPHTSLWSWRWNTKWFIITGCKRAIFIFQVRHQHKTVLNSSSGGSNR